MKNSELKPLSFLKKKVFLGVLVKIRIAAIFPIATFLLFAAFITTFAITFTTVFTKTASAPTDLSSHSYETLYTSILAGVPKIIPEAFLSVTGSGLTQASITTTSRVTFVDVKIQGQTEPPGGVDVPKGRTYGYFTITATNLADTDLSSVAFSFKIPKAWLSSPAPAASSVDKSTIVLYRLVGTSWTPLATNISSEDNSFVYYSATSSSLSTRHRQLCPSTSTSAPDGNIKCRPDSNLFSNIRISDNRPAFPVLDDQHGCDCWHNNRCNTFPALCRQALRQEKEIS